MSGIAVKLPVTRDKESGFSLLETYDEVATQNLKMLVLTSPGERMMDPDFGVGARRFLFEQMTEDTFQAFKSRLMQQQQKYLPYISIEDVRFTSAIGDSDFDENTLQISIMYFNKILKTSGVLSLPIT
jgi:phage baseplate assembly protein W|tara:strand:+ start:620 stop:1003 length:384 start_codon:yes stop_codon:yes gene_type:complete